MQACRFRGSAATARGWRSTSRASRSAGARQGSGGGRDHAAGAPTRDRLQTLGLDLTEHGDANSRRGRAARAAPTCATLRRAGFRYTVRIADLAARTHRNHLRDVRHARATAASGLPSGRDGYRRLPDYDLELKRLAMQYPSLARPITLNHRSLLGRDVNGDRDLDGRAEHRGRQADLPDHGRAPRARVAVVRAHDRVRLRPAAQLRERPAHDAARAGHAHHRRADREPGRVQHLARGARCSATSRCSTTR